MDFLFAVSGVKTNLFLPPLVAMVISFLTSMGGISGAFLLLPFQMSVLNYTAPSVSGTNHVFNIFAIPSGVYRYIKEGRMAWPLTWVVIAGTLPGVFLGYYARVHYIPDPRAFKLFVGSVLLFTGLRLLREFIKDTRRGVVSGSPSPEERFRARGEAGKRQEALRPVPVLTRDAVVRTISLSLTRVAYEFRGERFSFNTIEMFGLAFIVGIIGGAYGIGGGSIIAPFCVTVFHLPVYTVAGAALMATFMTSVAGALFFTLIPAGKGIAAMPDWPLGVLFGLGGFIGMYFGARFQKFVPQRFLKLMLGAVIVFLAIRYVVQYFMP
ncbi:MAG TPA: sulfite exporter TauE/SafE family protein [Thermodesulfovibrionales bacterium]|nr:sulfite exporter TauE/SafE family protein [Thermodesulfovibrionales bacterium]